MEIIDRECAVLGIPVAEHKKEGPTTRLTFLGIEIDTVQGIMRLPPEKIERFRILLDEWKERTSCTRKELESVIGHLNHACKVIRSARTFLRQMLDLLHSVH